MRIPNLPNWCITDKKAGFYDTESASAIKQTAKIYKAMQELQEDYNLFSSEVNTKIKEFMTSEEACREDFENEINKLVHDYIITIDSKIAHQDRVIEDAIVYIKDNLKQALSEFIKELQESGELSELILNTFNELDTRVNNLETLTSEHTTKIANLETSLAVTDEKVATNQTDIDTLESELATTNEALGVAETGIDNLAGRTTLLETKTTSLEGRATVHENYLDSQDNRISQVEASLENCKANGDFAVLTGRLTPELAQFVNTETGETTDGDYGVKYMTFSFPEGFTPDNCVVVSKMYKVENIWHRYTDYIHSNVCACLLEDLFVSLGKLDGTDDKVYVEIHTDSTYVGFDYDFKIVLMKI